MLTSFVVLEAQDSTSFVFLLQVVPHLFLIELPIKYALCHHYHQFIPNIAWTLALKNQIKFQKVQTSPLSIVCF